MSNEQKLREALQAVIAAHDACMRELGEQMRTANITNFRVDGQAVIDAFAAIEQARQALATTEPEPTGMPEVKPWDHPEPQTMRWSDLEIRWIQSYGEQCWKAGYKHGAWGDNKQTSKQSLQVEPAVNQQLTTEPVDERVAFEKWITKNGEWPNNAVRSCFDPDRYANFDIQGLWEAWQARAAMSKGVK